MRRYLGSGDPIGPHLLVKEPENGPLLGFIDALQVIVSEHDDSQIALILRPHMRALPTDRATSPDAARRIDREVIANVSERLWSASQMRPPDRFKAAARGCQRRLGEGRHAIVMDRDPVNRSHSVHSGRNRGALGPVSARQDACDAAAWQGGGAGRFRRRGRLPDRPWHPSQPCVRTGCAATEHQQGATKKCPSSGGISHVCRQRRSPPTESSASGVRPLEYTIDLPPDRP